MRFRSVSCVFLRNAWKQPACRQMVPRSELYTLEEPFVDRAEERRRLVASRRLLDELVRLAAKSP